MSSVDIDDILQNPDTSAWLKMALTAALECDPVRAAADAAILAKGLDKRLASILHEELQSESATPARAQDKSILAA
jgi:hypothetical protein